MKTARRASANKSTSHPTSLYLGCFYFDEPTAEGDRTGSFQMVVDASSPEQAVSRFRRDLQRLKESKNLFTEPVTIYLDGLIRLAGAFQRSLLVNWISRTHPEPESLSGTLSCLLPEEDREIDSFGFGVNPDETPRKDVPQEPFVDFGGTTTRKSLQPRAPVDERAPSDWQTRQLKEEARVKVAKRRAKTQRQRSLATTLEELEGTRE